MNRENQDYLNLIPTLVEKITKGVRKQLRGYVQQTKDEIDNYRKSIEYRTREFEHLVKISQTLHKDWYAVEAMINETKQNKKLIYDMQVAFSKTCDELIDMKLLNIEMRQKLEMLRK
jgi:hypothetical protein